MTFSRRKLEIRGYTQPLRPRNLSAERKTRTKGVIRSTGAKARGSKVRGYQAVCRPRSGGAVRAETRRQDPLPIRLAGLTPGKRYECTVRAKSRAGLGQAGTVVMPRRP
jgi:Fibronectin type III domain